MKKSFLPLLTFLFLYFSSQAQLFREEFDEANGATSGMDDGVSWSISTTDCTLSAGDLFEVQNNQFQITDTDCTSTASWTTGNINISGQSCVLVSVEVIDLATTGYENEDILQLVVRVDGGADLLLATLQSDELEQGTGNSTTAFGTVSLSGNSDLVVEIRANTSTGTESIAFDNVEVAVSSDCCPASTGAEVLLGAINPCGLDGENEYVVIRNGNNALDIDNCLLIGATVGLKNAISAPYNYNYTWNGTTGSGVAGTRPVDSAQPCGGGVSCYRFLDNDIVADQAEITNLIADLNDNIAGCDPFVDPGDAVPAGAIFVVFLGAGDGDGFDNDEDNFNFDYLCSYGEPVYLVFGTGTNNGFFENAAAGAERTYRVSVNGEDVNNLDYSVDVDGGSTQMGYVIAPDATAADYVVGQDCNTSNTPLPVELSDFYAKATAHFVELFWTTETETNNAWFAIEASGDGRRFKEIGQRKGAGTTVEPQHYHFSDNNPYAGKNYYRLRQVDTDGTAHYAEIISVFYQPKDFIINAFPSPASDKLTVETSEQILQFQIFDSFGRLVLEQDEDGAVQSELKIATLSAGQYVLRVQTERNVQTQLFIKQ